LKGEPDIKNKLLKGYDAGGKNFKVHLDRYDQREMLAGKSPDPRREFFYWTDDGNFAGLRYDQYKAVFIRASQFEDDIVNECEKDIRSCFDAGAAHVVMDFTEGRLAPRNDPRNPWTTRNLVPHVIELDSRVFDRFSATEREKIGIHVCPGGDVDSVHSADVPYEELLKHLFKLNAGYFQLQMASERDRESAYKLVGKYLRDDAKGVPQMAYIGCILTQSPRAASVQEVCDQLVAAAKYIDKQRIGSTDDCGFSPFSIDKKPNHGSPDYARDIAFQKIANRVAGTKMAAEKLGVH
jgi:methionine synthase II (cobalamin-independent)